MAFARAAEETGGLFANAPGWIVKRLRGIGGRAAGTSELSKPRASLSHTRGRGAQAGAFSNLSSSGHVPWKGKPPSAIPSLSGAYGPRDHSEYDV